MKIVDEVTTARIMKAAKEGKIVDAREPETILSVPSIGTGTLRTSATWIAVMLMAEDAKAEVLSEVMKVLNITPEEVADEYYDTMCPNCGMSMLSHRSNGDACY